MTTSSLDLRNNAVHKIKVNTSPKLNAALLKRHQHVISPESASGPFGVVIPQEETAALSTYPAALLLSKSFHKVCLSPCLFHGWHPAKHTCTAQSSHVQQYCMLGIVRCSNSRSEAPSLWRYASTVPIGMGHNRLRHDGTDLQQTSRRDAA